MSSKSRSSRAAGGRRPPAAAPAASEALAALQRRTIRAVVFLFVRLVAVSVFITILTLRYPQLRNSHLPDVVGILLVILPFFTAIGRGFAWRIALGRAYVGEGRWAEAEQALRVFDRAGYHPFDSHAEGAYWMAVTHRAQGRPEAARRLFGFVSRQGREPWQSRALAEAAAPDAAASPDPSDR